MLQRTKKADLKIKLHHLICKTRKLFVAFCIVGRPLTCPANIPSLAGFALRYSPKALTRREQRDYVVI